MTCCVRENADERLRGQVASLKALKPGRGQGPLIAVGGCIGQRDGERLLEQLPHVDVVFGTHNIAHLPALLETASTRRTPQIEILAESTEFASDLPSEREHPWHAWVPITVGCDNYCTYCVVPYVRGREKSRALDDIVREVERLVADGVLEVTLLGQNVNSYGRDLYGDPAFARVLREVARTGIERIRFATSHPKDLSDDTIAAMADEPAVMPYLHLPVQSGSNAVLDRMNRVYTRESYLALVERLYARIPHLALSTDIIVGLPGGVRGRFRGHLGRRAARSLRSGVHLHLLAARGHARSDHAIPGAPRCHPGAIRPARRAGAQLRAREGPRDRRNRPTGPVRGCQQARRTRPHGTHSGQQGGSRGARAGRSADEFAGRILDVRIDEAQTWFLTGSLGTNH